VAGKWVKGVDDGEKERAWGVDPLRKAFSSLSDISKLVLRVGSEDRSPGDEEEPYRCDSCSDSSRCSEEALPSIHCWTVLMKSFVVDWISMMLLGGHSQGFCSARRIERRVNLTM